MESEQEGLFLEVDPLTGLEVKPYRLRSKSPIFATLKIYRDTAEGRKRIVMQPNMLPHNAEAKASEHARMGYYCTVEWLDRDGIEVHKSYEPAARTYALVLPPETKQTY